MQRFSEKQVETSASEGMSMDRSVVALAHQIELNESRWRTAYILEDLAGGDDNAQRKTN